VLKLLEKQDNQLFNKELYDQIKIGLDHLYNMSPIIDK